MNNAFAVPQYVLRDGLQATGPILLQNLGVTDVPLAIFGFSDKPIYDRFIQQATRLLTPYPLVKGFLRNEIEQAEGNLRLVVLDAERPLQSIFFASTMQGILDSLQNGLNSVHATYQLSLDVSTSSFRATPIETTFTAKSTP